MRRPQAAFEGEVFGNGQVGLATDPVPRPDGRRPKVVPGIPNRLAPLDYVTFFVVREAHNRTHQAGFAASVLSLEQNELSRVQGEAHALEKAAFTADQRQVGNYQLGGQVIT